VLCVCACVCVVSSTRSVLWALTVILCISVSFLHPFHWTPSIESLPLKPNSQKNSAPAIPQSSLCSSSRWSADMECRQRLLSTSIAKLMTMLFWEIVLPKPFPAMHRPCPCSRSLLLCSKRCCTYCTKSWQAGFRCSFLTEVAAPGKRWPIFWRVIIVWIFVSVLRFRLCFLWASYNSESDLCYQPRQRRWWVDLGAHSYAAVRHWRIRSSLDLENQEQPRFGESGSAWIGESGSAWIVYALSCAMLSGKKLFSQFSFLCTVQKVGLCPEPPIHCI